MLCARAGLPSMAWLTISARAFLDAVAARVRGPGAVPAPPTPSGEDPIHTLTLDEMRRWAATGQWPARFDTVIRGWT